MAELGFSTYVFIERIAANAAALHPFPEHNVALVRDALADAGFDITLLGPDAPKVGEGVYFQPEPFGDEVMGLLADALTLRGIGAYAYALVDSSLGGDLADIALFTRVGDVFPRHGRHILMTRMYIHRTPTGAGNKAVTWAFGSPADLEEANRLLSEKFDTEPVTDPRGMAAIEIRHPEFAAGTAEPMAVSYTHLLPRVHLRQLEARRGDLTHRPAGPLVGHRPTIWAYTGLSPRSAT